MVSGGRSDFCKEKKLCSILLPIDESFYEAPDGPSFWACIFHHAFS
jgi:hypothetical protein